MASLVRGMLTVLLAVSPFGQETVVVEEVKSLGEVAVPLVRATSTETAPTSEPPRCRVRVSVPSFSIAEAVAEVKVRMAGFLTVTVAVDEVVEPLLLVTTTL